MQAGALGEISAAHEFEQRPEGVSKFVELVHLPSAPDGAVVAIRLARRAPGGRRKTARHSDSSTARSPEPAARSRRSWALVRTSSTASAPPPTAPAIVIR